MKVFLLLSILTIATAAPSPRTSHVVHETTSANHLNWVKTRKAGADTVLLMRFGLSQPNLHRMEELLMDVSHPESPNYGNHYTPAQVVDLFAPSAETVNSVTNWLTSAGFSRDRLKLSSNKGWIHLNATVAEAEDLLKTEYHVYAHTSGTNHIGCREYSVPAHIRDHVDLIQPTVHFNLHVSTHGGRIGRNAGFSMVSRSANRRSLTDCDVMITPECIRALYSVDYKPVSTSNNSFGIAELTPQAFLGPDLDIFFRKFAPDLVGVRPQTILIDGAVIQTQYQNFSVDGESSLELEYAMALTAPQPITLLQIGDLVQGASFNNMLDAIDGSYCTFEGGDDHDKDGIYPDTAPGGFNGSESCGVIAPPNVISVSYGGGEAEISSFYANRQCNEYAKLGLLGTTVIYSSGDSGVAGGSSSDPVCLESDGTSSVNGTRFNPGFPVTCPFVTAVGATQITRGSTVNDPETACETRIFSGGGFSNIFPMPDYQKDAVTNFLTSYPPPYTSAQFNNSGNARGFPDISANGANYVIAVNGQNITVFGTSASAPVVGSLITLVNDARIAAGKGPVGFINPSIYSTGFAEAFNDITSGGNQGCGTPGFNATKGWDPVTGVGTPNLTKLMPLFLALP